jgi:hypothetical protein
MSYVELVSSSFFFFFFFFQSEFAAPLPRMLFCGDSSESNDVIS